MYLHIECAGPSFPTDPLADYTLRSVHQSTPSVYVPSLIAALVFDVALVQQEGLASEESVDMIPAVASISRLCPFLVFLIYIYIYIYIYI